MKAYLFAVQWASKPSCLLVGLRTKRPLCSPSSVGEELQASFRSGGLFLLAEQIRSRSALRFRSTCEQGNSRSHAHRLRKIRVYLDAVYFTSRVHVCWLGLLSYVVISKYCRTFVWTFVPHRVRCVSESLDTWFLCWSCLTIHWIRCMSESMGTCSCVDHACLSIGSCGTQILWKARTHRLIGVSEDIEIGHWNLGQLRQGKMLFYERSVDS
jgi:hypothetical protein